MAGKLFTPYSSLFTANTKVQQLAWVPPEHQERVNAYLAYEQLYWNVQQDYRLLTRGTAEDEAVYVPRPKTIVETVNRYVGTDLGFTVDPETGTPNSQTLAKTTMDALFKRERVISQYNANKRFGLIRGDWLWHLMVDQGKPQGSRLRLVPVQALAYFPQYLDNDNTRLWKVHLLDRFMDATDNNKWKVRRLTYERSIVNTPAGPTLGAPIVWSLTQFDEEKWFTKDYAGEGGKVLQAPVQLHPDIDAIPVFHIPNFDEPGNVFGSSELRGVERVLSAINQGFSDEDLALALMGLGVYATDSTAPPRTPTGEVTNWSIYPGKVIQGAQNLRKVEGISSVVPYGDHLDRLINEIGLATGASAAATGSVDVQVAESGVALAMHLAPMLALAKEKDQIIEDVMAQLFFNIQKWYRVYEGTDFTDCEITPSFGDKLPVNTAAEVNMVAVLMTTDPPVMSAKTARAYLADKCGIQFDDKEGEIVLMEQESVTLARAPSQDVPIAADPNAGRDALDAGDPTAPADAEAVPTPGVVT